MKKLSLFASVSAALACAAVPVSFNNWSSANVAEARVGRPLTATSVAGVSRRVHRREYRRAVGAAAVGAAAAGVYFGQPAPAYELEPSVEPGYGVAAPDPYGAPAVYGEPAPYGEPLSVVRDFETKGDLNQEREFWRIMVDVTRLVCGEATDGFGWSCV